jgi:hypothetical protein
MAEAAARNSVGRRLMSPMVVFNFKVDDGLDRHATDAGHVGHMGYSARFSSSTRCAIILQSLDTQECKPNHSQQH